MSTAATLTQDSLPGHGEITRVVIRQRGIVDKLKRNRQSGQHEAQIGPGQAEPQVTPLESRRRGRRWLDIGRRSTEDERETQQAPDKCDWQRACYVLDDSAGWVLEFELRPRDLVSVVDVRIRDDRVEVLSTGVTKVVSPRLGIVLVWLRIREPKPQFEVGSLYL